MRHGACLAFALVLAACAPFGMVRPGATEADMRRSMGAPAVEYEAGGGLRQLVFPTGPLGTQTFMVYVRNGIVERSEQVLTDDTFYRVQSGVTTREELRRMIGPPYRVVRFDNLRQDAWDYRFRDTWGYLADFSAMIDERGVVAGKVITRFEQSRDSGFGR